MQRSVICYICYLLSLHFMLQFFFDMCNLIYRTSSLCQVHCVMILGIYFDNVNKISCYFQCYAWRTCRVKIKIKSFENHKSLDDGADLCVCSTEPGTSSHLRPRMWGYCIMVCQFTTQLVVFVPASGGMARLSWPWQLVSKLSWPDRFVYCPPHCLRET